jgi:hypothetical protein
MEKKRSAGVIVVSVLILLFPIIAMLIVRMISKLYTHNAILIWEEIKVLTKSKWISFIFFAILSIGVFKLNNKFRLITVVITTGMALAGPLGLAMAYFVTGPNIHARIVERYGMLVLIYPWLVVIPVCILYASIAFYLTRTKVKEQFK